MQESCVYPVIEEQQRRDTVGVDSDPEIIILIVDESS